MKQRLDILTLGVADVPRARAFYERLGWQLTFTDGDIVMFQAGPMVVSLWGRDQLAADSGIDTAGRPAAWGGFTLGYAVGGPGEVDALCEQAAQAGATITRAPVEKPFGYSGVFADLDGHTWEVAWIKALERRDDGSVALPS
jgi:predicted lactoylglutathione lyase